MIRADRWMIVGCGGAGKSTLARRMGEVLGLPVIHLDRHYWNPGWIPTEREAWAARARELAAGERWIMDGNYSSTLASRLPRAERVILLDPSPLTCLWRVVKRRWGGRPRPDLPEDCPDRLELQFLHWIATYRVRSRPRVLRALAGHPQLPLTILRTDREVERFLEELAASPGGDWGRYICR